MRSDMTNELEAAVLSILARNIPFAGRHAPEVTTEVVDAITPIIAAASERGGVEAETYRQMHEIATQELGYPSILEALEACPKADDEAHRDAWSDFEGNHLTDGKGYASANTYKACREAFEAAWPQGTDAAYSAALNALTALRTEATTSSYTPSSTAVSEREEVARIIARANAGSRYPELGDDDDCPVFIENYTAADAILDLLASTAREG